MTHPEKIWGKQQGDLCEQFIETARKHGFRHAYQFRMLGDEAIRAYGIGMCYYDVEGYKGAEWPAFLCEDSRLRINRRSTSSYSAPPHGYEDNEICDITRPEISGVTAGYFSRMASSSVVVGYTREWGTFLGERIHESQVNPWQREWFFPQTTEIVRSTGGGLRFHEELLEDMIAAHGTALTLPNSPVGQKASIDASDSPLLQKLYGHLGA